MVNIKKTWGRITSPEAKAKYKKAWETTSRGAQSVAGYAQRTNAGLDQAIGIGSPQQSGFRVPPGYVLKRTPKIVKTPNGHIITYDVSVVKIGSENAKPRKRRVKKVVKKVMKRKVKRRKK